MKQLNILILTVLMVSSCQLQQRVEEKIKSELQQQKRVKERVDLALTNFNKGKVANYLAEPETFKKGAGDFMRGDPNSVSYDMEKFRWGDYNFVSNNSVAQNNIEIIYEPTGFYPVVVWIQLFHKEAMHAAKHIMKQLTNQYSKPVLLHDSLYPVRGYTAYLWSNVEEDQSLLFCTTYSGYEPKSIDGLEIYIIKNSASIVGKNDGHNDMSILGYLVSAHSR